MENSPKTKAAIKEVMEDLKKMSEEELEEWWNECSDPVPSWVEFISQSHKEEEDESN